MKHCVSLRVVQGRSVTGDVQAWGSAKAPPTLHPQGLKGGGFLQGDEMGWGWHSYRKTLPANKQDCSAGLENGVKAVS